MPFIVKRLTIPEVLLISPSVFGDSRGFFIETYKKSEFEGLGMENEFVQDNHSHSTLGVLRGLHYQMNPKAQAKLVTAVRGSIFDVAVDIRRGSPTFGKWVGETLSDSNHFALLVPRGFAHGFCVTSNEADVVYKTSAEYSPQHERGIIWNDLRIGVAWPSESPILSKKDAGLPPFERAENNFDMHQE